MGCDMSRSTFTRLGDHIARDRAAEVRRRAAAGKDEALAELAKLQAGLTPAGLLDKAEGIASGMLARADAALRQVGHAAPHISADLGVVEHGLHLIEWSNAQVAAPDTLEGRMIHVIRMCGHAMMQFENGKPETLLGFILGYGIAQHYFLAFREYEDGPALARERELARGRAEGGKARKDAAKLRRDKIAAEFMAAWQANPRISAKGWAARNAERFELNPETVRKIAGAALRAAKKRPSTP